MKKILVATLLILVSNHARAQDITTTVCPGAGCVTINTSNQGSVGIQVIGTWVGTITFEGSINGTTFTSLVLVNAADTGGTGVTTTSSNGIWNGSVAGLQVIRARFSAYTSGTATIIMRSAQSAKRSLGTTGGGGGSGTVTEVDTTSPIAGGPINTVGTISCPTCLVSGGDLGTPSAGVATNITGIPSANLIGTIPVARFNSGTGAVSTTYLSGSGTWTTPPGSGGPSNATYITQTPNGILSNEQALSLLATGIMNVTTTTGVVTSLLPTDDNLLVGNGTVWENKALTDCTGASKAVTYAASSNTFGCNTISGSAGGTVTSVATTSPITGGTFTDSGTIACATCTTNGAALTNHGTVIGVGGQGVKVIAPGTAGQVMTSNGAGTDPSYQAAGNGTVTSVGVSVPGFLAVSGSPVTTTGTLAITASSQSANLVLASPNGASGAMTPRVLQFEDLPLTINENPITTSQTISVYGGAYEINCSMACNMNIPTVASHPGATIAFTSIGAGTVTLTGAGSETICVVAGCANTFTIGQYHSAYLAVTTAADKWVKKSGD